ncbi:MAG: NUDIX hydrolase [Oceanobacter sp.]
MTERWTPHATVATVIEQDGKFLMVEEISGGQQVINQPAGHIEANESIEQAALRETLEETGWEVELTNLIGLYTYTSKGTDPITYHRYCFAATALKHLPDYQLDEGILGPKWMSLEELESCQNLRSDLVLTCVKDWASGKRFPLNIIIEHP